MDSSNVHNIPVGMDHLGNNSSKNVDEIRETHETNIETIIVMPKTRNMDANGRFVILSNYVSINRLPGHDFERFIRSFHLTHISVYPVY